MTVPDRSQEEAERTIVVSHTIESPRRLVFEAWTEVRHLSRWFGPDGFTTTTKAFEFRPGGVWEFIMHGPDGTDYPNRIEWREILRPERISFWQGAEADDPDGFRSTVTFAEQQNGTEVTLRSLFNTKAQRDEVVERYGAVEGARQTLTRLASYIATLGAEEEVSAP